MRFFELNEIWQWCEEHGVTLTESHRLAADEQFSRTRREVFASGLPSGREPGVARELLDELGAWDECLLWVVTWGVWSSTEDWPEYYAARGQLGEKRSLEVAPALYVRRQDADTLRQFLASAMRYGWDAHVLPALDGTATPRRLFTSHDEWAELRERSA
jgi:hypothetical protein